MSKEVRGNFREMLSDIKEDNQFMVLSTIGVENSTKENGNLKHDPGSH